MTTNLTKTQLNTILSALEGKQRNPNDKDAALNAIARHGDALGISVDDILAAAGGLLDGRMSAEQWVSFLGSDVGDDGPKATDVAPPYASAAGGDHDVPARAAGDATPKARTVRPDTKQAAMIELLRRPEGATVEQIAEATGWQNHSVRGVIAGTLKKKLGLAIATEKARSGGGRCTIYRIVG